MPLGRAWPTRGRRRVDRDRRSAGMRDLSLAETRAGRMHRAGPRAGRAPESREWLERQCGLARATVRLRAPMRSRCGQGRPWSRQMLERGLDRSAIGAVERTRATDRCGPTDPNRRARSTRVGQPRVGTRTSTADPPHDDVPARTARDPRGCGRHPVVARIPSEREWRRRNVALDHAWARAMR
jgi:hypothetical protein